MAYERITDDLDVIVKLDDEPNDIGGLSAEELKAKFDEAGNAIKTYINETLLPAMEGENGAENIGITGISQISTATNVQDALILICQLINDISQGAVPDGSIGALKLADAAVTAAKIALSAVNSDNIVDGAVITAKLADLCISTAKLAAKCVTSSKIADGAVGTTQMAEGAVVNSKLGANAVQSNNIYEKAVSTTKLADEAVTAAKIAPNAVSRDKLADDALYSPVVLLTTNRNLALTDLGKTLLSNYSASDATRTITLTQAISTNLPVGFECAICRMWNNSKCRVSFSGVRVTFAGQQIASAASPKTVNLPEMGSMVALKKMESNSSSGDVWLLTGSAEVVS